MVIRLKSITFLNAKREHFRNFIVLVPKIVNIIHFLGILFAIRTILPEIC